jgi:hypothetical protein
VLGTRDADTIKIVFPDLKQADIIFKEDRGEGQREN